MKLYQQKVSNWMKSCFSKEVRDSQKERNLRFLEESLELVQSNGMTEIEVKEVLDYVYSRPAGDTFQEVGGVMVTLSALCEQAKIDLNDASRIELERISNPEVIVGIQKKWATKVKNKLGIYDS